MHIRPPADGSPHSGHGGFGVLSIRPRERPPQLLPQVRTWDVAGRNVAPQTMQDRSAIASSAGSRRL